MVRAPFGARRRGCRKDAAGGGEAVQKGPWMPGEDEMLLEHVRTHGPRDWSSIRSKGLLPRNGKSCRLRWVNKLRPYLKTCKFSTEEERVVIELQAQFGNKWALIATYLPGRTDNDVKNFWSTRQKRLARLLRTPLRPRSAKRSNKEPASSLESPMDSCQDHVPFVGNSFSGQCCVAAPPLECQDAGRVPHDQALAGPGFFSFEGHLPLQLMLPPTEGDASSSSAAQLAPPKLPFDHQSTYSLLDFPGLEPERCDTGPGFVGASTMDELAYQELLPIVQPAPMMKSFFDMECAHHAIKAETRDDIFDDLPPDMFDSLDQPPPPFSPSVTNSEV